MIIRMLNIKCTKLFFGYLSIRNKTIVRLFSIILIILSPIFYYKTIEGVFVEDIIAMYWYSSSFEIVYFWIFSFFVITFLSYIYFKILHTKMKNNLFRTVFTLLILLFIVKCSKDSDATDENSVIFSSLNENDIVLALEVHNDARAEVGVPSISWSNSLSQDATEWAKKMAEKDEMYHSSNDSRTNQGENLYYSSGSSPNPGDRASTLWYDEISDYTYAEIGSTVNANVMIGHYTQMIWSTTTEVGMGRAVSSSGKEYVVARYSPPGNWIGSFPY